MVADLIRVVDGGGGGSPGAGGGDANAGGSVLITCNPPTSRTQSFLRRPSL
jgi:hypothetical protein